MEEYQDIVNFIGSKPLNEVDYLIVKVIVFVFYSFPFKKPLPKPLDYKVNADASQDDYNW